MTSAYRLVLVSCLAIANLFVYAQDPTIGRVAERVATSIKAGAHFQLFEPFTLEVGNASLVKAVREEVRAGTLLELRTDVVADLLTASPEHVSMRIPVEGGFVQLDLVRVNILAPGFVAMKTSSTVPVTLPQALHYRGIISGDAHSLVAISVFTNGIMGIIGDDTGDRVLGRLKGGEDTHIFYAERDLVAANNAHCFTQENDVVPYLKDQLKPQGSRKSIDCVGLYWEVDYPILQSFGDMASTANFIMGLFNGSATLYANDGINVTLSELLVWDEPSPYTATSTSEQLDLFQGYRNSFNGNLGHLLGTVSSGGVAAGVSGICNPNLDYSMCYSDIQLTYNTVPTYSWSVEVVTHEQGHLMGSRHTHACVWNGNGTAIDGCGPDAGYPYEGSCSGAPIPSNGGTIMSYCHLVSAGINFNNGFGPQPQAVIMNEMTAASCLSACANPTCPAPDGLAASDITMSSALLTWNMVVEANSYTVEWKATSSATWTSASGVVGNQYPLTGLLPGTSYDCRVFSECADGGSLISDQGAFTTIEDPSLVCITIQPPATGGKDAAIHSLSSQVNVNYGNVDQLPSVAWTFGGIPGNVRSLIQFDLSTIPNVASIISARLTLFHWDETGGWGQHSTLSGSNEGLLRRVTGPWNESTVTWNTQPTSTPTGQVVMPASTSATQDYLDMDVTGLVQVMAANPATNYGFMMQQQTEDYYRRLNFCSSDHANPAFHPMLRVCHTPVVTVRPQALLQGPFDSGSSLMKDDLRLTGLIPIAEPYTSLGFTNMAGGGGETTTASVLATTGNNAVVDWIRVELRSALDPSIIMATRNALLQRDGDIVNATDGFGPVWFSVPEGDYYVAVRHRNHLGVMTAADLSLSGTPLMIDFRSSTTSTYGTEARKTIGNLQVLWMGDVVRDEPGPSELKYMGAQNDRDPILTAIGGVLPTNVVTGYYREDCTLDGKVKYIGVGNDRDPMLVNVGGGATGTRAEQLP